MAAGLLLKMVGFFVWALFWLGGSATVSTSAGAAFAGGHAVVVDARSAVAVTDEDFICATLDWWPPGKCDYGTCSWGLASLLNLVSFLLSLSLSPRTNTQQDRREGMQDAMLSFQI
jgi:heparanase